MKKVLSVALASAMVLGMGANAFAISYNSGSNDKADWPDNFKFDGELFVTNKDGDIVEEASTELNDNESVNFEPGDVIWMPLYADDQKKYDAEYNKGEDDVDAVSAVKVTADIDVVLQNGDKKLYAYEKTANSIPVRTRSMISQTIATSPLRRLVNLTRANSSTIWQK